MNESELNRKLAAYTAYDGTGTCPSCGGLNGSHQLIVGEFPCALRPDRTYLPGELRTKFGLRNLLNLSEEATMMSPPQESFRAYVDQTAQNSQPEMHAGMYENVEEFIFVHEGISVGARAKLFHPTVDNEWLSEGLSAGYAWESVEAGGSSRAVFASFVDGDVRYYRFDRFKDAVRAGELWADGR